VPKLDHGNDGIIFTMNCCPYYPGTCGEIVKWKPASMNSVDFIIRKLKMKSETEILWGLYCRNKDNPFHLFNCMIIDDPKLNEECQNELQNKNKNGTI